MAKTIELHFNTSLGKVVKLPVDSPIEPIDPVKVKEVMDLIIAQIFSLEIQALSLARKKLALLSIM